MCHRLLRSQSEKLGGKSGEIGDDEPGRTLYSTPIADAGRMSTAAWSEASALYQCGSSRVAPLVAVVESTDTRERNDHGVG